jgi:VWFA-related protein
MRSRSLILRSAAALALLLAGSFAALPSDKPKPQATVQEETRAVLVEVPVTVLDRAGKPVENLQLQDFEVFDDGKPQTITGFEVLDQRRPLPPPAAGEPPLNPAASRRFLLLFDLSFSSSRGVVAARRSARDFVVNRMKELDTAAVATYSVETGVRLLVGFTGDRTQLAAAVDTLGLPGFAQRSPDPLGLLVISPNQVSDSPFATVGDSGNALDAAMGEAIENMQTMFEKSHRSIYRDRVSRLLTSFSQLAVALDAVPGRKHILYLSEGFDSRELSGATGPNAGAKDAELAIRGQTWRIDNDSRFGNTDLRAIVTRALGLFNRSDCIIHSIDIGGLRTGVAMTAGEAPVNGQDSLYYLSEETGGEFLKNANNLGPAFDELLDRTGLIYLLAFQPVRIPENGKFHALKVKMKNRSWRVSHRSGYYEPKAQNALTPMERRLAMASAVSAALPKTDVPAWVLATPLPPAGGRSRVPVVIEVPGDRLLVSHNFPKMTVDLFVYAIDREGQTRDYLVQPVTIDLAKAEGALARGGLKYYGELQLPPGDYTLRTLVRDNESGRFGVTITPVHVADVGGPTALPPIFLEQAKDWIMVKARPRSPAEEVAEYPFVIAGESFVPAAFAGTKNGEPNKVCLIVYNLPGDAASLQYSARAIGEDGKAHGRVELALLKASDKERAGARKLLLAMRVWGLDPGRYALSVNIAGEGGKSLSEGRSAFDVQ